VNKIIIDLPTQPLRNPYMDRVYLEYSSLQLVELRSDSIEAWLELALAVGAKLQDWALEDGTNVVRLAQEVAGSFEALADDWARALRNLE
jgi:hypothetical protein